MPGAFSPIFPPPQSIDSLDSWGSLDDLPFSLDSFLWTTAGLYGLTVSDAAQVRPHVNGQRTRTSTIAGMAVSGDSADGQAVLELMGTGEATTGESVIGGVTVAIGVDPSRASSGQTLVILRIRPGLMDDAAARSNEGLDLYRVRTHVPESLIVSGGDADVSRTILLYGGGDVISADDVLPEYKGWAWTREAQMEQGWSPILGTEQDWRQIPGSTNKWRSIVEWQ